MFPLYIAQRTIYSIAINLRQIAYYLVFIFPHPDTLKANRLKINIKYSFLRKCFVFILLNDLRGNA